MSASNAIRGHIQNAFFLKSPTKGQAFAVKFFPWHAYTITTSQAVMKDLDPLHNHYVKRWESRKDPFWYSFTCFKNAGDKKVVKGYLQRRVKEALILSLEKYGYDRNGTWVASRDVAHPINPYGGQDFYGTAQFMVDVQCLKTKFVDVQAQMDTCIKDMLARIGQNQQKQKSGPQKRKTNNNSPGGRKSRQALPSNGTFRISR
jgi:hypothetical protein